MLKTTHTSFPQEGVDVHISASEALAHGIKPGDPAVVEVTVRPYTPEEWTAEGIERNFQSEVEEVELAGHHVEPGADPGAVPAQAVRAEDGDGHPRIWWKSEPRAAAAPDPVAVPAEPAVPAAAEGHTRIRWKSERRPVAAPEPVAVPATPNGSAAEDDRTRIRWRSARTRG